MNQNLPENTPNIGVDGPDAAKIMLGLSWDDITRNFVRPGVASMRESDRVLVVRLMRAQEVVAEMIAAEPKVVVVVEADLPDLDDVMGVVGVVSGAPTLRSVIEGEYPGADWDGAVTSGMDIEDAPLGWLTLVVISSEGLFARVFRRRPDNLQIS